MQEHSRRIVDVQLYDDQVCDIRDVMSTAVPEISRICPSEGPVRELCGRVGEYRVPPVEEERWVAGRGYRVITCAVACGHCGSE